MTEAKKDDRNIYQRINDVMKEVRYVQKDAQISGGGPSYRAVTHDQVVSVARAALVDNGIVIYPQQQQGEIVQARDPEKGIKMHLYRGSYKINFVNIDIPQESIEVLIEAHAADNGDKAPGKCITYATKSAILKVLCLETGENDESREQFRERTASINDDQMELLMGAIKAAGMTTQEFCGHKKVSIQSLSAFPAARFEGAIKWLSGLNKEG